VFIIKVALKLQQARFNRGQHLGLHPGLLAR